MTNRYPGDCAECGGRVPAGEGECEKEGGRWVVRHRPRKCPSRVAAKTRPARNLCSFVGCDGEIGTGGSCGVCGMRPGSGVPIPPPSEPVALVADGDAGADRDGFDGDDAVVPEGGAR